MEISRYLRGESCEDSKYERGMMRMQPVELAVTGCARAESRDVMTYSACDHLRGPCEYVLLFEAYRRCLG